MFQKLYWSILTFLWLQLIIIICIDAASGLGGHYTVLWLEASRKLFVITVSAVACILITAPVGAVYKAEEGLISIISSVGNVNNFT